MTAQNLLLHELLHVAAAATHLADQAPVTAYRRTVVHLHVDHDQDDGRCLIVPPETAGVDKDDLLAVAAAGPLALAPRPAALIRAAPSLQAAAGLSPRDTAILRKYRGKLRDLERILAATAGLAKALPMSRLVSTLAGRINAEHPIALDLLVPRAQACAALGLVDKRFHERRRDPHRAPSFAERPL